MASGLIDAHQGEPPPAIGTTVPLFDGKTLVQVRNFALQELGRR